MDSLTRVTAVLLALLLIVGAVSPTQAAVPTTEDPPPRLSLADGEVSFWRPGAQDWAPAQVNTPMSPGDELYTGHQGNLEVQVGGRAFVRAWGDTQIGLANHEPDFLQFKITAGHASVDLRSVDPGRTVEIDTPQAAFTIEQPGYYRIDVTPVRTSFIARRGGRATMTLTDGQASTIPPSEEVVLEGAATASVQSYVAPELDTWDRWNYTRTEQLLDAVSARYVPSQVYGVDDLDHYGNWRVVPAYGSLWVPEAVPVGWAPYSVGKWIWDPYYGWTWVDAAPWGWAPFHYGRWVFVDRFWAWAPGPVVVRPVYAPALVAFFGGSGIHVGISAPLVSWAALGWGEPLIPWWGRPGFVGRPSWRGWGGPRVVNNVVVNRTTVVDITNVTVYRNAGVQNAVVAVRQDEFNRRRVQEARIERIDARHLEPVRGPLRMTPEASSFVAASGLAVRPPDATTARRVVATRSMASRRVAQPSEVSRASSPVNVPPPRTVSPPRTTETVPVPPRPPFGASSIERPRPPLPPRFETREHAASLPTAPQANGRPTPVAPRENGQRHETAAPEARGAVHGAPSAPPPAAVPPPPRPEPARSPTRQLPGEPANRLFPGRAETELRRPDSASVVAPHAAPSGVTREERGPAPGGHR